MSGAPTPQVLLEAIAANAAAGPLPGNKTAPMPETQPGTINAASIQTGFNANVMTNENAGGRPPLGPDINGMFFLVSSHNLYVQCGQTYKFNSDVATSIGGYLAGTILGMTDNSGLWLNLTDGNSTNPDTGGAGWVPMASYGFANITGLTGGTVNLTQAQAKFGVVILNGILTSNLTLNFPQTIQQWLVINRTSGAFTITAQTAAGGSSGQVIPQGGFAGPFAIYSIGDGNIYPTIPPLGIAIDQSGTPLTIVQRTNNSEILTRYFVSSAPVTNPGISNVVVDSGNGYFQKSDLTNFEAQLLLQGIGGQLVNGQVPYSVISQWSSALFSSPNFTGAPTTPTAGLGTSNTLVASTAFANPGVTVNGNGICITLPSGYKIQAGACNPAGGSAVVTFPVPFTSTVNGVTAISVAGGAVQTWLAANPGLANMTVRNSGGNSFWIAIGL